VGLQFELRPGARIGILVTQDPASRTLFRSEPIRAVGCCGLDLPVPLIRSRPGAPTPLVQQTRDDETPATANPTCCSREALRETDRLRERRPDSARDLLTCKPSRHSTALDLGSCLRHSWRSGRNPGDERGPRTPEAPERVPGPPSRRPARFPLPTACLSNPPRPPEGHVSSPFGLCTPGLGASQAGTHKIWWLDDSTGTTG